MKPQIWGKENRSPYKNQNTTFCNESNLNMVEERILTIESVDSQATFQDENEIANKNIFANGIIQAFKFENSTNKLEDSRELHEFDFEANAIKVINCEDKTRNTRNKKDLIKEKYDEEAENCLIDCLKEEIKDRNEEIKSHKLFINQLKNSLLMLIQQEQRQTRLKNTNSNSNSILQLNHHNNLYKF